MTYLENPAYCLRARKVRCSLKVLLGTLCIAFIAVARGQSATSSLENIEPAPLRTTQSLSQSKKKSAVRAARADRAEKSLSLRITTELSPTVPSNVASNGRATGTAPTGPAPTGVEGPEDPVAFEAVRPGPPSSAPQTPQSLPKELPDLASIGWVIPPIRWGGNTTSNYNWFKGEGGGRLLNETQTLNLRASSFIYQPWYATVAGDIGLLAGKSKSSGGESGENTKTRSSSTTYGGNFSLFPQSRFPFNAFLQTGDSRAKASDQEEVSKTLRMGARQNYRPETGPENYSATTDRSTVKTKTLRSIVDTLTGTYGTVIANNTLSATTNYSNTTNSAIAGSTRQGSRLLSLNGSQSWRADEEYQVASAASFISNRISWHDDENTSLDKGTLLQANSSVTWIPDEDLPLTVTGGGNLLRYNTESDNSKTKFTSLGGYANANYRFSQNLTGMTGLTVNRNKDEGPSVTTTGQTASVSYSGNPLTFGDYSYNWGTGAGVSTLRIPGRSSRTTSTSVQHSVQRSLVLSDNSRINLNASQNFSKGKNSGTESTGTATIRTNTGGAAWQLKIGDITLGNLSATVSDSKSTGSFSNHTRSFSSLGNLQTQLNARSTLMGSLNYTYGEQLDAPAAIGPVNLPGTFIPQTVDNKSIARNGSTQITYSHRSPFDIPNLLYSANLQANHSKTNLRLITGNPDADAWQKGSVIQHNANYRMGKLSFQFTRTDARLNGKKNASMYLGINRELGDY